MKNVSIKKEENDKQRYSSDAYTHVHCFVPWPPSIFTQCYRSGKRVISRPQLEQFSPGPIQYPGEARKSWRCQLNGSEQSTFPVLSIFHIFASHFFFQASTSFSLLCFMHMNEVFTIKCINVHTYVCTSAEEVRLSQPFFAFVL